MMDQEKVIQFVSTFYSMRKGIHAFLRNHENYIEIKKKTKTNTNKRIRHTNHKATLH